jgi:Uma2 family endonuclease
VKTARAMAIRAGATLADLYRVPDKGKAELVNGDLVLMSPTGGVPGRAAGRIYRSLDDYERESGGGYAFPDNVGFVVDLPDRRSFSPDAAFWVGELPAGGQFLTGAPVFAVEVRSENDYGPEADEAELALARKRADYFAAGTQVVWDVDVLREGEIRSYRSDSPQRPAIFRRGQRADADPALPGWSIPADEVLVSRRP